MLRRLAVLVPLLACAGPSAEAPGPVPTRLEPRIAAAFDAKYFASTQLSPSECETGARRLHETSADNGWDGLKACIERSRWPRGEFTLLERLTGGFWDEDLQKRPDAPRILARVIALRGGDIEGDIPAIQKTRAPLFTLAAAMRQPEVYKGRYVVVRGALDDVKMDAGKATALMSETSLRATAREVDVGTRYRSEYSSSGSGQADVKTTRYGDTSASGSYSHAGRSESGAVKTRFENERKPTGRQVLGRLPQADPFLEPGKDFVFLARFDGMRAAAEQEKPIAVLTIVGYYKPNALLLE